MMSEQEFKDLNNLISDLRTANKQIGYYLNSGDDVRRIEAERKSNDISLEIQERLINLTEWKKS